MIKPCELLETPVSGQSASNLFIERESSTTIEICLKRVKYIDMAVEVQGILFVGL